MSTVLPSGSTRLGGRRRGPDADVVEVGFAQYMALLFGLVFIVVGGLGFGPSSDHAFAARDSGELLGLFEVNALHNLVHLGAGLVLLGAFMTTPRIAALVSALLGAVYLLVGVVGFFLIGTQANILALNTADNFLHLFLASALLLVGLLGLALSKKRSRS